MELQACDWKAANNLTASWLLPRIVSSQFGGWKFRFLMTQVECHSKTHKDCRGWRVRKFALPTPCLSPNLSSPQTLADYAQTRAQFDATLDLLPARSTREDIATLSDRDNIRARRTGPNLATVGCDSMRVLSRAFARGRPRKCKKPRNCWALRSIASC